MVHTCCVSNCKSEWYPGQYLNFHMFPKDTERREKWLSLVPLKTKFYEQARVCSLHFRETDYLQVGSRLKHTAVPHFDHTDGSCKINDCLSILLSNDIQEEIKQKVVEDRRYTGSIEVTDGSSTDPIEDIKDDSFIVSLEDRNSPSKVYVEDISLKEIKPTVAHKLIQTQIKCPQVENLQRKNKAMGQRIQRQKRTIEKMKALIKFYKKLLEAKDIVKQTQAINSEEDTWCIVVQ